jgi:hypothetical protein
VRVTKSPDMSNTALLPALYLVARGHGLLLDFLVMRLLYCYHEEARGQARALGRT